MRSPDLEGFPLFLGPHHDGGKRALECGEDQGAGVPDLERQGGVDHVRGRQPVVEPTAGLAELLGDGVYEGGDVVVGERLDFGDALRRGRFGLRRDLGDGLGRNDADLRPSFERRELDVEPARELALVRPDPGHGRAGVAGDH